jgi:hypothetical protein
MDLRLRHHQNWDKTNLWMDLRLRHHQNWDKTNPWMDLRLRHHQNWTKANPWMEHFHHQNWDKTNPWMERFRHQNWTKASLLKVKELLSKVETILNKEILLSGYLLHREMQVKEWDKIMQE